MSDPLLQTTPDDLNDRLDSLGLALGARESHEPPATVLAAVRARTRRTTMARYAGPLAVATMLTLAAGVYMATHAGSRPINVEPTIVKNAARIDQPTFAALRTLNRDATPETLRFPSSTVGSSVGSDPSAVMQPRYARDPEAMARLLGSSR